MRRALAISLAASFALPLPAQQVSAPQSQTIQMQCRDLNPSGNDVGPGEILVGGKACRQVGTQSQAVTSAVKPALRSDTSASADASVPTGFLLEDGTPVHLVLSENLSSASAVTGQIVEFEVVDDVVVNGLLVVPRSSTAWATVTDAEHKRHLGRGGKLDLNIDRVRLADGEKVLLRAVKESQGGGHTGAMTGAIVATSLVLLPAAPLFLFMHGKDVNIPRGTQITAFVQGDVRLDASKFQRQPALAK